MIGEEGLEDAAGREDASVEQDEAFRAWLFGACETMDEDEFRRALATAADSSDEDEGFLADLDASAVRLGPKRVLMAVSSVLREKGMEPRTRRVVERVLVAAMGGESDPGSGSVGPSGGGPVGVRPGPRSPVLVPGAARRIEEACEPPRNP